MWKGVEAERRLRALLGDGARDPVAHVAGDELERRRALGAQLAEEALDRLLVTPLGRPDEPARVVADDDADIALALAVGELVDPDPLQAAQGIAAPALLVGDDPLDDPPDRVPGDAHQLADRALRALRRQPGDLLFELTREPRIVPRPGQAGDDDAVLAALDPRCLGFDVGPPRAEVERPPAPPALALVVAGAAAPAAPAARRLPPPRAGRDNDRPVLLQPDPLDHRPAQAEQASEYSPSAHAVTCLPREPTLEAGNLRTRAACAFSATHGTVRTA